MVSDSRFTKVRGSARVASRSSKPAWPSPLSPGFISKAGRHTDRGYGAGYGERLRNSYAHPKRFDRGVGARLCHTRVIWNAGRCSGVWRSATGRQCRSLPKIRLRFRLQIPTKTTGRYRSAAPVARRAPSPDTARCRFRPHPSAGPGKHPGQTYLWRSRERVRPATFDSSGRIQTGWARTGDCKRAAPSIASRRSALMYRLRTRSLAAPGHAGDERGGGV